MFRPPEGYDGDASVLRGRESEDPLTVDSQKIGKWRVTKVLVPARLQYEWSHRAKSREVVKHAVRALDASPARDREDEDEQLAQLMVLLAFISLTQLRIQEVNWEDMFPNPNSTLEENDRKRLQVCSVNRVLLTRTNSGGLGAIP